VKRNLASFVSCLVGWCLLGCDEPLKAVELVSEPRVLGARVEVAGDPGRAAPAPGETATVSFLLAAPERRLSLGFALAVCSAATRQGARSGCAAAPFAQVSSAEGEADVPTLTFEVPEDLEASGRLAVLGIVCPQGSPSADAMRCEGAEPGTRVQLELELSRDGDVNLNPELPSDAITFDGEVWADVPSVDGDCPGLGFPEVAVGSKHELTVALDEGDRDQLPHPAKLDPLRESLQLAHFATDGDLQHAFDTIAWDSEQLTRSVTWVAPKQPGLTRFWLVLRDFRGGSAFTERAVCVQ
jgi:hypothetical protein